MLTRRVTGSLSLVTTLSSSVKLAVTVAVLLDRYRLEWVRFVAHSGLPGWLKMVLFGWL